MDAPETLAVLRFGGVGDVLLTAPALDALRSAWPRTRILYAVKAPYQALVAHHPAVDEVVPLAAGETPWSLARRLRRLLRRCERMHRPRPDPLPRAIALRQASLDRSPATASPFDPFS